MGPVLTFGLGVNTNQALQDVLERSVIAEALRLDYLWVADSPNQLYGPVVASRIASVTRRVRIGLGLMSILLHTPRQIASAMISLSEAYGERFDLCIGAGDRQQLQHVGISIDEARDLRSAILAARRKIASYMHRAGVNARIWLGAQGPKMLGIAKEFDGVLLNYSKPEMIRSALDKAQLARLQHIKIGTYSPSYVYIEPQPELMTMAKVSSAVVAIGASAMVLREFGLYEDLRKAREMAKGASALESILDAIPDWVIEHFSITMTTDQLHMYLAELHKLAVSHVVFGYPQNHSDETVRDLGEALERSHFKSEKW